jgi:hypothetical protein
MEGADEHDTENEAVAVCLARGGAVLRTPKAHTASCTETDGQVKAQITRKGQLTR